MKVLVFLFVAFFLHFSWAQSTVKGLVFDENNVPIEGATILFKKDVTIGAQTDAKGAFDINVPSGDIKLLIRFSGMKNDTLSLSLVANETREVSIFMKPYSINKEQVTV